MSKTRVLFVCTGNSCRSQIAEGLLRHLAPENTEVFSAGTHPMSPNPRAIEAMKEIDVDISNQTSNHVNEYASETFDWVITVCDSANQRCPVFTGAKNRLHWSIPDPFDVDGPPQMIAQAFRAVREDLKTRIQSLMEQF